MHSSFSQRSHFIAESLESRRLMASGPLVITHGGTYTGSFESTDYRVAAISVKTTEAVVIQNATVKGSGDLIASGIPHTNITVRNTRGYSVNPNIAGAPKGNFFTSDMFDNAILENNYLEGTSGIHLVEYQGNHTAANSVRVFGNRVKNIDGRKSDGKGGYLDFNARTRLSDNFYEEGFVLTHFLQLNKVIGAPGIDIGWNEIINEPGESRVEDVINIYKSSGTSSSPILIHDNYVQGAYTIKPWQATHTDATYTWDWSYTGGGILLGDGSNGILSEDPGFVRAYNNQVVDTTNYGIGIFTGHDLQYFDNRIISSGILADGRTIAAQNTGAYVWDAKRLGATRFFNNVSRNNVIGWRHEDTRNDWWIPDSNNNQGNIHWPQPITREDESVEYGVWLTKMYGKFPERKPGKPPAPKLSLSGTIFNDTDGDAVRDSSEMGIGGFRVYLDKNNNKKFDKGEIGTRSTSTGRYLFYDLLAASYMVRVTSVEGWRDTQGMFARVSVRAAAGTTRYFGFTNRALATGVVFLDFNKDRLINKGELGLAGWRIFADLDNDGVLDKNEPTSLTSKSGVYALSLPAGSYSLRVVRQAAFKNTTFAVRLVTLGNGAIGIVHFGQNRIG